MTSVTFKTPLSAQEQEVYGQHFRKLDPEDLGIVTGESVKHLFNQSGLNAQLLSQIWATCDNGNQGFLNLSQFSAALRIIGHLQSNPSLTVSVELYQDPPARLASLNKSGLSPSNTSTANSSVGAIPLVSSYDIAKFSQLFDRSTNGAPILQGDKAKDIFLKAKLPTATLGSIWNLCDRENSGSLDKSEFIMAMHLIQLAMTNNPVLATVPDNLPGYLWDAVSPSNLPHSSVSPSSTGLSVNSPVSRQPSLVRVPSSTFSNAASDWTLSFEKKQQFDTIFDSLDKSKAGTLSSQTLVPFFLSSRLSQDTLASVWDLADIHNNAEFTKLEFAIAMFLIQKKKTGIELPDVVPDQLLRSPALGLYPPVQQQVSASLPAVPSRDTKPSFNAPPQTVQRNQSALGDLLTLNESFSPQPTPIRVPSNSTGNSIGATQSPGVTGSTAGMRKFQPSSTFGQSIIKEEAAESASQNAGGHYQPQQVTRQPLNPQYEATQQQSQFQTPQQHPQQPGSQHEPAQQSQYQAAQPQLQYQAQQQQPQFQSPVQTKPSFSNDESISNGTFEAPNAANTASQPASRSLAQQTQQGSHSSSLPNVPNFSSPPLRQASLNVSGHNDGDTSLQLSQATTELANLSNQVGSLTNQATLVNERKTRAQQELKRINDLKSSIESKMVTLRGSYERELNETEQLESSLVKSRQESEELKRELAVAEANHHAVQGSLTELQQQLQESEQSNSQLKEKIGNLNAITASLQAELNSRQQKVKQERSMVDVNSRQLEVSEITTTNLQNEIQGLEQHLDMFKQKHKELEDYKSTLESKHGELNSRHQVLEEQHAGISRREQEVQERSRQVEEQEKIYHQEIAKLQNMFEDLSAQRESFAKAEDELQKQQFEYAQKVQELSERRMKLAMGELPEDSDEISKNHRAYSSNQDHIAKFVDESVTNSRLGGQEDEDKQESDVFDKDVPTVGSQTEVDDEDRRSNDDETAAQALADRFDGDLNEYGIPRTESVTSSVMNNAPQSVRDYAEGDLATLAAPGESATRTAETQSAKTTEAVEGNMPGGWSGEQENNAKQQEEHQVTLPKSSDQESEAETLKNATKESYEEPSESAERAITEEFPPIQELEINESESDSSLSDDDEGFKDAEGSAQQRATKPTEIKGTSPNKAAVPARALKPIEESDIPAQNPEAVVENAATTNSAGDKRPPQEPVTLKPPTTISSATEHASKVESSDLEASAEDKLASKEKTPEDFDDEFAGLEQAAPEEEEEEAIDHLNENEYSEGFETIDHNDLDEELNQGGFTGVPATEAHVGTDKPAATVGADEWDEIFAGFGNAGQAPASVTQPATSRIKQPTPIRTTREVPAVPINRAIATTPKSLAIEELGSMGFTTEEATKALEHCNWDLGAATNYLLDSS
ncbi:LAQU0S19e01244g1_1 [Lachancea quebecensis]|uniref:LAQU0S19e01244g1_1 n=1 Tax=Lachancea quebecensis TaxID=1654605 RepID=A0A0P1KXW1_9SACH|nr:LAQU0S19e01244g1_1 [Lachancea quebecensis]